MKWICSALLVAVVGILPVAIDAQDLPRNLSNVPTKNPLEGNAEAIRAGMGMYRVRCADCHGMDARGIRAPDLSQVWASGRTDDGLFRTVRTGVAGSEMPAIGNRNSDEDVWKILAYVRTLAAAAPTDLPRGNAENGERIFRANCNSCHLVNGRGGRLGPDLSRVGAARTRAALTRQIRGAVEGFRPGYEPVTLTTRGGRTIHGVKKNEDLFSVQIMDTGERIQGYLKEDMRTVTDDKRSAMPPYDTERLTESAVDDLIAYLSTLRGASTAAPITGR
jgi:putative heme-binding domain-containing protein